MSAAPGGRRGGEADDLGEQALEVVEAWAGGRRRLAAERGGDFALGEG